MVREQYKFPREDGDIDRVSRRERREFDCGSGSKRRKWITVGRENHTDFWILSTNLASDETAFPSSTCNIVKREGK